MTRIGIDPNKCQGMGECCALAPELISVDELGIAHLRDPTVTIDAVTAQRLVAVCPSGAIRLVDHR